MTLVHKIKFLGVIIDLKLTWHEHIYYLSSHVAKGAGIISRLKYILHKSVLRTLYFSLSTFTYCSSVWSSTKKSNLNSLILLQKRNVRHICHSNPRDHTGTLQNVELIKTLRYYQSRNSFVHLSLHPQHITTRLLKLFHN